MNFFDGHAFSLYDSTPDHQGESRHVPVYYGVQYNHAGRFRFALNHGPVMEYEGAYAFVTHPGAFFEYGNVPGETRHHSFLCSQYIHQKNKHKAYFFFSTSLVAPVLVHPSNVSLVLHL